MVFSLDADFYELQRNQTGTHSSLSMGPRAQPKCQQPANRVSVSEWETDAADSSAQGVSRPSLCRDCSPTLPPPTLIPSWREDPVFTLAQGPTERPAVYLQGRPSSSFIYLFTVEDQDGGGETELTSGAVGDPGPSP